MPHVPAPKMLGAVGRAVFMDAALCLPAAYPVGVVVPDGKVPFRPDPIDEPGDLVVGPLQVPLRLPNLLHLLMQMLVQMPYLSPRIPQLIPFHTHDDFASPSHNRT